MMGHVLTSYLRLLFGVIIAHELLRFVQASNTDIRSAVVHLNIGGPQAHCCGRRHPQFSREFSDAVGALARLEMRIRAIARQATGMRSSNPPLYHISAVVLAALVLKTVSALGGAILG